MRDLGVIVISLSFMALAFYGFTVGAFWATMPEARRRMIDFESRICDLEDMRRKDAISKD